jgi:H+-transporting ATPase
MARNTENYNQQMVAETLKSFEVQADNGLTNAEANQRIEQYGYNEIEEKEESLWHRVFRRFWGP